jgi:DNA adenine methylase
MSRPQKQIVQPIPASFENVSRALVNSQLFDVMLPPKITQIKSPLRYPGGKTRGIKEIIKYFPPGLDKVCSPFLGGGSIELELANRGVEVFGYDIFEPVVTFWQVLLTDARGLATFIKQFYPLTPSKFYSLQKEYFKIKNKKKRAAAFYALNRASFSGTTLSGGMSPNHPRFTKPNIEQLANFKIDNLHVSRADFKKSLTKHKNDFLYLDPPYFIESKLYGKNGDTHRDFDHDGLAAIITKREGWILSYNDCPKVRTLYKGFKTLTPQWVYGMNKDKKSNELLILSRDFVQVS